ncbi:MAG: V-type ATP synthase subunit A [Planctomycetota bacterium]|jgi:V/A-type H+-transporting ATPase subunit A
MAESQVTGKVIKVSGPLVVARGLTGAQMYGMVRVGEMGLFGEIIEMRGDLYSIQVYEETEGVGPGEPVVTTGEALSVELGPGLIQSIYDGVQRPLDVLRERYGEYITRGVEAPSLDREKKWNFEPVAKPGDEVVAGDVLGTVKESPLVVHRVMVPPGLGGKVAEVGSGEMTVEDVCARLETPEGPREIQLAQRWPVRRGRPVTRKLPQTEMLVTGQRVLDMFFPLAKGGTACVPGPFGSGKTVVQHQLAKWADADIIVYVGCGERGNEMTDVLQEFPELADPRSGRPLMERTVMVANTSNMPVAAREASVFTGITMAEYYRDMGYSVGLMADSTSRWAEAMREISGRLEEMPGEEGYPAYLASRIASFYERSGLVTCLGSEERKGSLSLIGAVSPPGGDMSEPVVQATLRVVKVFWGLDDRLAFARHFPAVNWLNSYSLYQPVVDQAMSDRVDPAWRDNRRAAMGLLQRESELEELVRLVGMDALAPNERLLLEAAKMVREDFLHQNAFDEKDTYTSVELQFSLLDAILHYYDQARKTLDEGGVLEEILELPVKESIARGKLLDEKEIGKFEEMKDLIDTQLAAVTREEVTA